MRFFEILTIAFDALLRNKLRSLLTMLGIIIGVGAVIAMVAIGQGAQSSVESQINSLGTNVLLIFPGNSNKGGVSGGAATGTTLTEDDAKAIKEQCPAVSLVSPMLRNGGQVVFGNMNWGTSLQGGSIDYFGIRDWRLDEGDFFTEQDVRASTKVCLLGQTVVQQLFQNADPIGETVRIRNIPFKVVGTLKPKGQNVMGQDQDDIILMPYTTLLKRLMGSNIRNWGVVASAATKNQIPDAQQQITELLRVRHKTAPAEDADFTIRNQTDIAEASSATSKIMTLLLGSIAGVSLIVGGIGIMNIMLVSVTERTREIGIRKAIGAKKNDILQQFLIEAVVMGVVGGIIGVGIGVGASKLIAVFAMWPVVVSNSSILLSVSFSGAVGVFFGYYPARKAAGLNPIEALRYE